MQSNGNLTETMKVFKRNAAYKIYKQRFEKLLKNTIDLVNNINSEQRFDAYKTTDQDMNL